ncbi:MAG: hypothetical protein PeribacterA2_0175 [Candidatus Peribacter riflensis]|uniref:AtpZ/AtpI family protein n=1 Tax=Candidatus Peribacter riflensis TaxID=1735162 RepID=A0A0S1SG29_9BACT|nr:MAG: hypothetical protein PeribacterA2_0175 [Candidatus Peribacter riflensis]ALM12876.1 MAG: hypothetical protein PeribacterD1_0175 [Candidatus Peribacter riflensis]ALM13977.1 MAG: hypothetical protein PeribacterD2_0175 [Candidatus Peribacter riflensis]
MNDAPRSDGSKGMGLMLSLRLAWNLGFIIAVPVAVFGFGGAYLDKYLQTTPIFVITGFVLAIVLTVIGVYRKVKEILGAS